MCTHSNAFDSSLSCTVSLYHSPCEYASRFLCAFYVDVYVWKIGKLLKRKFSTSAVDVIQSPTVELLTIRFSILQWIVDSDRRYIFICCWSLFFHAEISLFSLFPSIFIFSSYFSCCVFHILFYRFSVSAIDGKIRRHIKRTALRTKSESEEDKIEFLVCFSSGDVEVSISVKIYSIFFFAHSICA